MTETPVTAVPDNQLGPRLVYTMPNWARRWASGLISIVFHATLLTGFGLWAYGFRGSPTPGGDEVMIAELPFVELDEENVTDLDAQSESGNEATSMELSEIAPLSVADAGQMELVDVTSSLGVGGQGAVNSEAAAAAETGMAAQASFMGLQATGQRFCIIADCSGSMKGGKIDHVRQQVLKTISGLSGATRFQIFFFNSKAVPYPHGGWRRPGVELGEVRRWVENQISARGGTKPLTAFVNAFEMRPRPDVIFFMTDGKFDATVVREVERLNKGGRRVPIHTITFVDRSAETLMRLIASQSGGRYRHVAGF